jgi:hypothetical protein
MTHTSGCAVPKLNFCLSASAAFSFIVLTTDGDSTPASVNGRKAQQAAHQTPQGGPCKTMQDHATMSHSARASGRANGAVPRTGGIHWHDFVHDRGAPGGRHHPRTAGAAVQVLHVARTSHSRLNTRDTGRPRRPRDPATPRPGLEWWGGGEGWGGGGMCGCGAMWGLLTKDASGAGTEWWWSGSPTACPLTCRYIRTNTSTTSAKANPPMNVVETFQPKPSGCWGTDTHSTCKGREHKHTGRNQDSKRSGSAAVSSALYNYGNAVQTTPRRTSSTASGSMCSKAPPNSAPTASAPMSSTILRRLVKYGNTTTWRQRGEGTAARRLEGLKQEGAPAGGACAMNASADISTREPQHPGTGHPGTKETHGQRRRCVVLWSSGRTVQRLPSPASSATHQNNNAANAGHKDGGHGVPPGLCVGQALLALLLRHHAFAVPMGAAGPDADAMLKVQLGLRGLIHFSVANQVLLALGGGGGKGRTNTLHRQRQQQWQRHTTTQAPKATSGTGRTAQHLPPCR